MSEDALIVNARKRYRPFSEYVQQRFNTRVYKITIDAGFTCPNRDGSVGKGGCTFCNNSGFNLNTRNRKDQLEQIDQQIEQGIRFLKHRYNAEKFFAYFQSYTNSYAPIDQLKRLYDSALKYPQIVGLDIGTRPDCVPDPVLELLQEYQQDGKEVWLELGLQSANNQTLKKINRGHDSACFFDAIERAKGRGLKICVHVILGLPGETREDMLNTAKAISGLEFHGLKIHVLHINKKTALAKDYKNGNVDLLQMNEYAALVVDFLQYIPSNVIIQRLTGDGIPDILVAPSWCLNKGKTIQAIHHEMIRRNFHQGDHFESLN